MVGGLTIALLCAVPATPLRAQAPIAIGETFTIASKALGEERRINVYRPPAWGEPEGAPRPVLYMPDGGVAEDFLHIAGLLQVSVGNGTMRPFMLVGIENTERRRDMTGPTEVAGDRKIAPRVGGSAAFRQFIRDELIPAIDARYPTTRERAIVGESLAGLFVVETLLTEPAMFDTYIAFDPSLWWNGGRMVNEAGPRLQALPLEKPATLYLATSADGGLEALMPRLTNALADGPAALTWHHASMPEETHATIYHPAALRAFRALFKPEPD